MKKLISVAGLCAAVVMAIGVAAPAARATTVTAVYTGTIRNGDDSGNHFNGGLNSGDAFTLTAFFKAPPGTYDSTGGGSITGGGTVTLNTNGQNYTFNLSPNSYSLNNFGQIKLFTGDTSSTFLASDFYSPSLPASILTAFDGGCYADTYCSGSFEITTGGFSGASFDATHLNVTATPIPAALPLFASALLGLGFVARRRKTNGAMSIG
jgi:hypothetical protein